MSRTSGCGLDLHGRRSRWVAAVLALLVSLALTIAPAGRAHAAEPDTIFGLTNQSRAAAGLGPLSRDGAMDQVALDWANQMAASGTMSHNPSFSAQIPGGWSGAAENVAQGHPDGAAMHQGWMNSPGHRANILGDYTAIGIAFVSAGGTTWGVQVFGKYGARVTAPAVPAPPPAPAPPAPAPAPAPQAAAPPPAAQPPPVSSSPEAEPLPGGGPPAELETARHAASRTALSADDRRDEPIASAILTRSEPAQSGGVIVGLAIIAALAAAVVLLHRRARSSRVAPGLRAPRSH